MKVVESNPITIKNLSILKLGEPHYRHITDIRDRKVIKSGNGFGKFRLFKLGGKDEH